MQERANITTTTDSSVTHSHSFIQQMALAVSRNTSAAYQTETVDWHQNENGKLER